MVKLKIPLADVIIKESLSGREVTDPVCRGEQWQANGNEFAMQAPGVGSFYASDGREVVYCIEQGADPDWVKLYLNGQVLVALLHQRKIINFHASSFIYIGQGIMIAGETGAGKSSLTLSFVLRGAGFLTDDLTPVIFREEKPAVLALPRRMKMREGAARQMNVDSDLLTDAETGTGKKYLEVKTAGVADHSLDIILKIEVGDVSRPEFHEPSPSEAFSLLRSEICSWEMLAGMPETEAEYLQQLIQIVHHVKFIRVVRPAEIKIPAFHRAIEGFLTTEVH